MCSARSAFRLLNDVALKSIGGGCFFFEGEEEEGEVQKKEGHKVFSTEHRGIKRDESQNFLGLSTSSKEGEIIQIVWPHLYIFCMDQHPPPPQSKETKKETDESNDLFRVTHFPASPRGSSSVGDDDDFDDDDDDDDDECDDDEKKVLPVWCLQTTTEEKRDAIDLSTAGTKK